MAENRAGLLDGKAGYITGAAGGIGRGIAVELAREGASVIVSDVASAEDGGHKTVQLVEEAGSQAHWVPADVSSSEDVARLIDTTVSTFGRLDYAVNNAGIAVHKKLHEVTEEEYDTIMGVNLKGVFLGLQQAIPVMTQQGGGSIVNMSSVAGDVAINLISPYVASKHGINGLTKAAAQEYGEYGVRVNAVAPNAIRTPLMDNSPQDFVEELIAPQAIRRPGEVEEVGFIVASLLSDRSSYVTGTIVPVDGGYLTGPAPS